MRCALKTGAASAPPARPSPTSSPPYLLDAQSLGFRPTAAATTAQRRAIKERGVTTLSAIVEECRRDNTALGRADLRAWEHALQVHTAVDVTRATFGEALLDAAVFSAPAERQIILQPLTDYAGAELVCTDDVDTVCVMTNHLAVFRMLQFVPKTDAW